MGGDNGMKGGGWMMGWGFAGAKGKKRTRRSACGSGLAKKRESLTACSKAGERVAGILNVVLLEYVSLPKSQDLKECSYVL